MACFHLLKQGQNQPFCHVHITECAVILHAMYLKRLAEQDLQAAGSLSPVEALRSLRTPEVLVLDEARRLPDTARIVKGWYDAKVQIRILLPGSSSLDPVDPFAANLLDS